MEPTETEAEVLQVVKERMQKGREKYGEGINYTQLDNPVKWVSEAIEETADLLQYLVALRQRLKKGALRGKKIGRRKRTK